ncbi:MAG TPA: O-antigen ligase family protein [Verrucomicrobiota bacterium]|nr:O-antigen ligase family protein [Verrucomicrobiota bacterium]HNU53392.1 O-antigen ligase family protein [Verrucomicrobiota bacterium]
MSREVLDKWCERGILALVAGVLVLAAGLTGAVRVQDFAWVQGLVVIATACWILRFWLNPSHRLQWPPVCWAVVAFAGYAVLRYSQAPVEYVARKELFRILLYAWLFFIVLNNLHRQETTAYLVGALLVLGSLLAVYAIYQFLTDSSTVWHFPRPPQYKGRGSGTFICPNHLAGFLEMLLPVAMALVLMSRSKAVTKVFYGYMALVLLAGIGVSISRGGWVATGLTLMIFFAFLFRQRGYRLVVGLSVVVILIVGAVYIMQAREVQKRFVRMFTPGQLHDARVRPVLWRPAWQMWQDHFWLGVGPAHFDVRFPAYRPPELQTRPLYVHNDYLNALADWGAVGGGILLGGLVCVGFGVARTLRYVHRNQNDLAARRSDRAAYVLGLSLGLVAILFHSAVDFSLQIPANALLAVTLAASLSSHLRFATDRYWFSPRWIGRLVATVIGLAVAVFFCREGRRGYREGTLLLAAETAASETAQITAYRAAYQVEPRNADTVAKLAEILRLRSWEGNEHWEALIQEAMRWFELAMRLNPHDSYPVLRYGMCLDWLQRSAEADACFERATALDANSYYVAILRGWHEIQKGDYAAAKRWLERSIEIQWWENPLAYNYLAIVNRRLPAADKP